jgi:hypothetical protein
MSETIVPNASAFQIVIFEEMIPGVLASLYDVAVPFFMTHILFSRGRVGVPCPLALWAGETV